MDNVGEYMISEFIQINCTLSPIKTLQWEFRYTIGMFHGWITFNMKHPEYKKSMLLLVLIE